MRFGGSSIVRRAKKQLYEWSKKQRIENVDGSLENELAKLLNRHCVENASNTPDYILAQFLLGCLATFNVATQQRETWYGRDARPTGPGEISPR